MIVNLGVANSLCFTRSNFNALYFSDSLVLVDHLNPMFASGNSEAFYRSRSDKRSINKNFKRDLAIDVQGSKAILVSIYGSDLDFSIKSAEAGGGHFLTGFCGSCTNKGNPDSGNKKEDQGYYNKVVFISFHNVLACFCVFYELNLLFLLN